MKVALVHDHFFEFGGAERVAVALKKIFPEADIFTAGYNAHVLKKRAPEIAISNIRTSWAAHIPFFNKLYSPLRFLTPWIWESFVFADYDLVISSSGWFMSKGIITRKGTKHISYIHHQPRYLYYYETAVEWQKHLLIKIYAHFINHFLRTWDYIGSQRPDVLITNSQETRRRIQKFYRRDAAVVYPPVNIPEEVVMEERTPEYYVTLSRLARAKNIDVIIKAATKLKISLKIVGTGRDEAYLKSLAGPTVEFAGHLKDRDFARFYKSAKAFLNAGIDEEFGIAPVEAMSHGVPVIAYASGGLTETIKDGHNGYLFNDLTEESLAAQITKTEKLSRTEYLAMCKNARSEAQKYSFEKFKEHILAHYLTTRI